MEVGGWIIAGTNIFYSPSWFFSSLLGNSYFPVKEGRMAPLSLLCPLTFHLGRQLWAELVYLPGLPPTAHRRHSLQLAVYKNPKRQREAQPPSRWIKWRRWQQRRQVMKKEFFFSLERGQPGFACPSLPCREPPDPGCHLQPLGALLGR